MKILFDNFLKASQPACFHHIRILSSTERGRDALRKRGFLPLIADLSTLGKRLKINACFYSNRL